MPFQLQNEVDKLDCDEESNYDPRSLGPIDDFVKEGLPSIDSHLHPSNVGVCIDTVVDGSALLRKTQWVAVIILEVQHAELRLVFVLRLPQLMCVYHVVPGVLSTGPQKDHHNQGKEED